MKERLKELRKKINLSQENFGDRLGVTKASISRLESGVNNLTDTMIKLICSEFNVNEDWLRYGIGEMLVANTEDIFGELDHKFQMGDVFKKAVVTYLNANELTKKVIDDYLDKVFKEVNSNK